MNPALAEKVRQVCSLDDKQELAALFSDFMEHFGAIPLDDSDVSDSQALNDLVRDNITLNGVDFFGNSQQFLKALRRVIDLFLTLALAGGNPSANEISKRILRKASRTTSGSDSYFTAQQLFSSNDRYLLKPRGFAQPPIDIELFLLDGCIHSKVTCTNLYGLYSMDDINSTYNGGIGIPPTEWLPLDTTVVESTNHRTNQNIRYLSIVIPRAAEILSDTYGSTQNDENEFANAKKCGGNLMSDVSTNGNRSRASTLSPGMLFI